MDVMTFVPPLIMPSASEEQLSNFSKRAQRVYHENQRSNLLTLTQLILNSFIDQTIRGTRILDPGVETRQMTDFFIILEKIFWHGFRQQSSFISRWKPEADIWYFLGIVSKANDQMVTTYKTIADMGELKSPITKFRGFWRLAIMQKNLAKYFEIVYESDAKNDFYEHWALLLNEKCAFLCGAFLALGVFDCDLMLDNDNFQEQINSFDITPYFRMPTQSFHHLTISEVSQREEQPSSDKSNDNEQHCEEISKILDQKQYLEERNLQLSNNLELLKRKLDNITENGSFNESFSANDDRSVIFTERLRDLEKEREILRARLGEKEDTLRTIQDQLEGMKSFTEDLYEKLRAAENKGKRLQRDLKELKELNEKEVYEMSNSLHSLHLSLITDGKDGERVKESPIDSMEILCQEVHNKTLQYTELMSKLKAKHQELSSEREQMASVKRRCIELEARIDAMSKREKELVELREVHRRTKNELIECRQALEEFSEALSKSKLCTMELKEQILPQAQWIKDSEARQCLLCDIKFNITSRRHHCRNCGQIFCNACSNYRMKLPSNPQTVRVCLNCFHHLNNKSPIIHNESPGRNSRMHVGTSFINEEER